VKFCDYIFGGDNTNKGYIDVMPNDIVRLRVTTFNGTGFTGPCPLDKVLEVAGSFGQELADATGEAVYVTVNEHNVAIIRPGPEHYPSVPPAVA